MQRGKAEPAREQDLPESVAARARGLAAAVLGKVPADSLPPTLRRAASFAPARRAQVAGAQILERRRSDERFRESLAVQLRGAFAGLAAEIEALEPDAPVPGPEAIALGYLLDLPGWQRWVAEVAAVDAKERATAEAQQEEREVTRLQDRIGSLEAEREAMLAQHAEQVAKLKRDNAELRRRLGEARAEVRAAQEQAVPSAAPAPEEPPSTDTTELDRLRARVEQLESELAARRRWEPAARDVESMRARLLLDTVIDAAQGLRRELALPAHDLLPADLVEADVAIAGERTSSGHGSLAIDDPALLDQLLQIPRTHLVIDGYNVTMSAWESSPLDRQRELLISQLGPLAARTGAAVTVVFDAAETRERPFVTTPRGVRVLFSPFGVIADDVIRDLASAEPTGRPMLVVTSDQAVVRDVVAQGARVVASAGLVRLLAR